jgi:hypothetical protein
MAKTSTADHKSHLEFQVVNKVAAIMEASAPDQDLLTLLCLKARGFLAQRPHLN